MAFDTASLYLVQSQINGQVWTAQAIPVIGFPPYPLGIFAQDFIIEGSESQRFKLVPVPESGDSIFYMQSESGFLLKQSSTLIQSTEPLGSPGLGDEYKWVIRAEENSWVSIRSMNGDYLKEEKEMTSSGDYIQGNYQDRTLFRIISGEIQWEMVMLGTVAHQPLLPPAKLEFAFSNVLKNCQSGTLSSTVGRSDTRSQTYTIGSEESIQLYSSHTASISITAGVEFDAKFFGKGASYSLESTAAYEYTTSETTTKTKYFEETKSQSIDVSWERVVNVNPYSAVEVSDAVQVLNDFRIPYTKTFRIRGKNKHGEYLSGDAINFQLFSNLFEGVVTEVGPDYLDLSMKVTAVVDRFMQAETIVEELDLCN